MKNAINLNGHVLLCDIVTALEPILTEETLKQVDEQTAKRSEELIMFDDTEVLVEEAIDALDDADALPEPEQLTYTLDERTVIGLAEAIRCGERGQAEELLDRLFADTAEFPTIREWIDRGRFSMKARKANRAPAKLRTAA